MSHNRMEIIQRQIASRKWLNTYKGTQVSDYDKFFKTSGDLDLISILS